MCCFNHMKHLINWRRWRKCKSSWIFSFFVRNKINNRKSESDECKRESHKQSESKSESESSDKRKNKSKNKNKNKNSKRRNKNWLQNESKSIKKKIDNDRTKINDFFMRTKISFDHHLFQILLYNNKSLSNDKQRTTKHDFLRFFFVKQTRFHFSSKILVISLREQRIISHEMLEKLFLHDDRIV